MVVSGRVASGRIAYQGDKNEDEFAAGRTRADHRRMQRPNVQAVQQQEAAPVNCATAESDLKTLQSEKVSTAKADRGRRYRDYADGLVAGAPPVPRKASCRSRRATTTS